jgi:peptide/nickel transport system substrate-binding protein
MTEESIFFNLAYYSNPELDQIIMDADEYCATDREKASELYQKAGNIISDDAVSTFVNDTQSIYVIRSNLKNFNDDPAYPQVLFFYDFYRE